MRNRSEQSCDLLCAWLLIPASYFCKESSCFVFFLAGKLQVLKLAMRPESSEPIAPNSPLFLCVRKFTLVTIKRNNMLSPFKKKCDTNGGGGKCAGNAIGGFLRQF